MPTRAAKEKAMLEYCQCAKTSLNSWPVGATDYYCPGCGRGLNAIKALPNKNTKVETLPFFSLEDSTRGILRSNLALERNTLNFKGKVAFHPDLILGELKCELLVKKDNHRIALNPWVEGPKTGLSFKFSDIQGLGKDKLDPGQLPTKVEFYFYYVKNPSRSLLHCKEGVLGLSPTGRPFDIQIQGLEKPVAIQDTFHWLTTESISDTLKIEFTSRYPFQLLGYSFNKCKIPPRKFRTFYCENEKEILEFAGISVHANKAHFKIAFNLAGCDPENSQFTYDCVIEKVTSDLLQIVEENPNAEIKIFSNSETDFLANFLVGERKTPDLKIIAIHSLDRYQCVRLETKMPLDLRGNRIPVRFALNPSRFDRNQDHGKLYKIPLEIRDNLGRRWDLEMAVRVVRLEAQGQVVALDWGTTFSCLAIFDSRKGAPRHLTDRSGLENRDSYPERGWAIPSKLAVEKLDPVSRRFELIVGNDSRLQTYSQSAPHCLITSLKRQFYQHEQIKIYDKEHRSMEVSTQELVVEYLKQLIFAVEKNEKFEFVEIGFSYPTKAKYKDYKRFCETLALVEKSMNESRPGLSVKLLPAISAPLGNYRHTPDEASAIALDHLHRGPAAHKNSAEILVIYDFGGGTIDSAVLQILESGSSRKTELLGSSGNSRFGGDNITGAIIQLIIKKITLADPTIRIPLYDNAETNESGDTPAGRENKTNLEGIAENLKKNFKGYAEKKELDFTSYLKKIKDRAGKPVYDLLCGHEKNIPEKQSALLRFSIREVYDWNVKLGGGPTSTIRELIQGSVDDLKRICHKNNNVIPSKIILAGQGSNLPLVYDTFASEFDREIIDFDRERAKTRLAIGLSHFLNGVQGESVEYPVNFLPFSMSAHFPLGIMRRVAEGHGSKEDFLEMIPIGAPLDGFRDQDVIIRELELTGKTNLELTRNLPGEWGRKIGKFNLSQPIAIDGVCPPSFFPPGAHSQKVPPNWIGSVKALFLFKNYKDLYLVLKTQGESWGPFSFELSTPYASSLQDAVQGN